MAVISTPEAVFLQIHQSLCGSSYQSKQKHKLATGQAGLSRHNEMVAEIIDDIFTTLGLDPQVGSDALMNLTDMYGANKAFELGTWTYEADERQVVWHMLGHNYIPGIARIAANWNLPETISKDMPAGRFWYLPDVVEKDGKRHLNMPVSQIVDWLLDLLEMPMEHFAAERGDSVQDDLLFEMIRSLYKWKDGTLPDLSTLDRYFPDTMKIDYRGVFRVDVTQPLAARFKEALEFIKHKGLTATTLHMEISINALERIENILDGNADEDEQENFIDLLARRYAPPTPKTIRQRLLIARMVQNGYTRLRKKLFPDVANDCSDPAENKLLQLFELYKVVYNLTVQAFSERGDLGEAAENQWFEEQLPQNLKTELCLSILPSQFGASGQLHGEMASRRFSRMRSGEDLVNHLWLNEADARLDVEFWQDFFTGHDRAEELALALRRGSPTKTLESEDSFDVLWLMLGLEKLRQKARDAIITRLHETASTTAQAAQVLLSEIEYSLNSGNRKSVDALLANAKAHDGYEIWKGPFLHLEGKHLLKCNDFKGAAKCFRAASKDCLIRNYGPLRGYLAKDLFATEIADQKLIPENHEKYYREILHYGQHGENELASLEDMARFVSDYFWHKLYTPYPNVEARKPILEKEANERIAPVFTYIIESNMDGLNAWIRENKALFIKQFHSATGDSVLMLLMKMWTSFRKKGLPDVSVRKFEKAFRKAILMFVSTTPQQLQIADFKGQTPLMLAAEHGDAVLMKSMIKAGADPLLQDYQGKSALNAAIATGSVDVIDALLEHPECVKKTTIDGATPAHTTIRAGDIKTLKRLLSITPELAEAASVEGTPVELAKALLEDPAKLQHLRTQTKQSARRCTTPDKLRECIDFLQAIQPKID
jgi:hypothetical protein